MTDSMHCDVLNVQKKILKVLEQLLFGCIWKVCVTIVKGVVVLMVKIIGSTSKLLIAN